MTKAALRTLVQSIGLEKGELASTALQGILGLRSDKQVGDVCRQIEGILGEYDQTKQQRYDEKRTTLEKSVRESLHGMRIAGSAVGEINAEAGEAWESMVGALQSQFDAHLSKLKESLAAALEQA